MSRKMKRQEKTGRPIKPINWDKVDELLLAGCTGVEIAAYLDIHQNTFYERTSQEKGKCFSVYMQEKRQKGDSLLRAHQYAKALGLTTKGDNTLLVWLGKNRLKQTDGYATEIKEAFADLFDNERELSADSFDTTTESEAQEPDVEAE